MVEQEIIKCLAEGIAKRDLASLSKHVDGKTFVQAFNELKGFNLTSDPIMCGNELMSFNTFFDCNYMGVCATIFMTKDGGCEVHETCDVWVDTPNYCECAVRGVSVAF